MHLTKKKQKKKSVTTRCAFFSFYKYREGYKFRKVTDTSRHLLSLITVEQKTCYWSEFTLLFIANIFVVLFGHCAMWYSWTKRVSNCTMLCLYIIRTSYATFCYAVAHLLFFRRFHDEWTLQYTVQIIVNLRKEAKIGGRSTSIPHNTRKSKEVFLISVKPSSLW